MKFADFGNESYISGVSSDVLNLKAIYQSILEAFDKSSYSMYGVFSGGDKPKLQLPAGVVSLELHFVIDVFRGERSVFGRIVFVYDDEILKTRVPVHAVQFGANGAVYRSDDKNEFLVYNRENGFLPSSAGILAAGVNSRIVEYHTSKMNSPSA